MHNIKYYIYKFLCQKIYYINKLIKRDTLIYKIIEVDKHVLRIYENDNNEGLRLICIYYTPFHTRNSIDFNKVKRNSIPIRLILFNSQETMESQMV